MLFKKVSHFPQIPVNYIWVEDHDISVNAEDDSDYDCGHVEDLEEGMDDVGVESIVNIVEVLTLVVELDHVDNNHE